MEPTYEKAFADAEWQALGNESRSVIQNGRYELYARCHKRARDRE